jgi:acyl-CoA synthetase (NDP forming)
MSLEELIDTAVLFRHCSNCEPKHNSILMITWSGGSSVLGVDSIARLNAGIDIPAIQEPTRSKMKELIRVGSIANPLDLPDMRDDNIRFELFKLAMSEDYISGAIRLSTGPRRRRRVQDEEAIKKFYADLVRYKELCDKLKKPYMLTVPNSDIDFRKKLVELEIPAFSTFARAAKAFSNLYHYKNSKRKT